MTRVVATGTFDLLHPGHLYYLEESRRLGDELFVIVARDANVKHKPRPVVPEDQRLAMVRALKPVDGARLGDPVDMFRPVEELSPDVITIGWNQHFDERGLSSALEARGCGCRVVRVGAFEGAPLCSSRRIVDRVCAERCGPA
ncbi:MAG: FAD synthase [Methanospirillum sp.]|nr:FAD synthase [Methanospirillum sp.]